jgi:(S)-2-hydroxyglutarate dehydrogenase
MIDKADFLIIGAGVIGLSVARELQLRFPHDSVVVLERESSIGRHASGKNSGVLHSGIYYPRDSFKANFCKEGNRQWKEYCTERKLPLDLCGKMIVPRANSDHETLVLLENRAIANGIDVERVDKSQTSGIVNSQTDISYSLFVPSTASIDPIISLNSLRKDFIDRGGVIHLRSQVIDISESFILTLSGKKIGYSHLFNCAGSYADKLAHQVGVGMKYTLLPVKGEYSLIKDPIITPDYHIYPVPDLSFPFLGEHITRTFNKDLKIGPSSHPIFRVEGYGDSLNQNIRETLRIFSVYTRLFLSNRNNFRRLAINESIKSLFNLQSREVTKLFNGFNHDDVVNKYSSGIRPQLVDTLKNELVLDFVLETDNHITHVLNAISPAFTCAFPFARYIVDEALKK